MSTYTSVNNIAYPPTSSITINGAGSGYSVGGAGGTVTLNTGAGVGGSGSYLIANGGGLSGATSATTYTTSWTQPNAHFQNSNGDTLMTIPHGQKSIVLEEKATLEVNGTIKMNGELLHERLERIEKVLHIPVRDVTMEEKHPKLKKLFEEYMHELEKYRTWDRLKGKEDGTT
jgi:hypothetical protein